MPLRPHLSSHLVCYRDLYPSVALELIRKNVYEAAFGPVTPQTHPKDAKVNISINIRDIEYTFYLLVSCHREAVRPTSQGITIRREAADLDEKQYLFKADTNFMMPAHRDNFVLDFTPMRHDMIPDLSEPLTFERCQRSRRRWQMSDVGGS